MKKWFWSPTVLAAFQIKVLAQFVEIGLLAGSTVLRTPARVLSKFMPHLLTAAALTMMGAETLQSPSRAETF